MEHDDSPTAAHLRALVPDRRLVTQRVPLDTLHQDPANARALKWSSDFRGRAPRLQVP